MGTAIHPECCHNLLFLSQNIKNYNQRSLQRTLKLFTSKYKNSSCGGFSKFKPKIFSKLCVQVLFFNVYIKKWHFLCHQWGQK